MYPLMVIVGLGTTFDLTELHLSTMKALCKVPLKGAVCYKMMYLSTTASSSQVSSNEVP